MSAAIQDLIEPTDTLAPLRRSTEFVETAIPAKSPAKIMVVDDEPTNIKVVRRLLELAGYSQFVSTTDPTSAISLLRNERPDVVLLDLMMPEISGLDILTEVRADEDFATTPIIILTAVTERDTKIQALNLGATDFLAKPLDPSELIARVRNVLTAKSHQDLLKSRSDDLESAVRERTRELEESRRDVIHCLARAAEYRDDDTGFHVLRVGKYARLIGEALGMAADDADVLEQAAQLHDVGKIGIPDAMLLKPGKLTSEEFSVMQKHCGFGKHILHPANSEAELVIQRHSELGAKILEVGTSPVLALAEKIALTHHEWWDGTGYPFKLSGEDIPLEGRITAVADVFDALSSKRCYKDAFPMNKCIEIMLSERGTHFDPVLLDLFLARKKEITAIQLSCADDN